MNKDETEARCAVFFILKKLKLQFSRQTRIENLITKESRKHSKWRVNGSSGWHLFNHLQPTKGIACNLYKRKGTSELVEDVS